MNKVGKIKDKNISLTEKSELDVELSIIVEKNMLPPKIAEDMNLQRRTIQWH